MRSESAGAAMLMVAAFVALVWANVSDTYDEFWAAHLSVHAGPLHLDESLRHWVNELLMAVFFFVVALEVKRELLFGALRDRRSALTPAAAAFGTMLGAAGVYLAVNAGGDLRGWAVPIATDIAFALGVLGLAGRRAPKELRTFMLTLAVVDDLATIVVIAAFFTKDLSFGWLTVAAVLLALTAGARAVGIRHLLVYGLLAGAVWFAVFESGVHATVAGVALGFLTPAVASPFSVERLRLSDAPNRQHHRRDDGHGHDEGSAAAPARAASNASPTITPLLRMEKALHPYSTYLILPIFALANAGVPISLGSLGDALTNGVGLGIFLGLVVGAPVGGLILAFLTVRSRLARMPDNVDWAGIAAVAPLKGIGFTIAIFITTLAFDSRGHEETATLAVLAASLVSALVGLAVLFARHAPARRSAAASSTMDPR